MTSKERSMPFSGRRPPNLGRCRPRALTMCCPRGRESICMGSQGLRLYVLATLPQRNLHPRPGRALKGLRGSHGGNDRKRGRPRELLYVAPTPGRTRAE